MCSCIIQCIQNTQTQGNDSDMFLNMKGGLLSMKFGRIIELICKYAENGSNMCSTCLLVSPIVKFSFLQIHVFADRLFSQKRRVTSIIRLKFMLTRHRVKEKVNACFMLCLRSLFILSRCAQPRQSSSFA